MHVTRASVVTPSSLSLPFRFPTRLDNGTRTVRVRRQSVSLVQFRPSRGTPARRSPTARLYRAAAGLNTIDDNEHATVPVGQPAHADARRSRRQPCSTGRTRTDFHLHFIYTTAQDKIRNHAHAHEMSEPSHPQRTALFADLTILYNNTTFLPRT
jgi:hypothetical protein